MTLFNRLSVILGFYLLSSSVYAQNSAVFTEKSMVFENAVQQYEDKLYGLCIKSMDKFLAEYQPIVSHDLNSMRTEAELYKAKSAIRLDLPEAEAMIRQFVLNHAPDPKINEAYFEIGQYYYSKKDYVKVIEYFNLVNTENIPPHFEHEVNFKLGYAYFVRKDFFNAQRTLDKNANISGEYRDDSNYYLAMASYYLGELDVAVNRFETVKNTDRYRAYVPYYLIQIYFKLKEYDKLIMYGESLSEGKGIKNYNDIRLLIGQAYFIKKDYVNAIKHLAYYESKSVNMAKENFYQLAFSYYKLNDCENAVPHFKTISNDDSEMAQNANYYLADCLLADGDQISALPALKRVSQMNYNQFMKQEAFFNYGKLSAELGYDNQALETLIQVKSDSRYFEEAQEVFGSLMLRTNDYVKAIEILDGLEIKNEKLKEAHQKVLLYRGIQLINEGKLASGLNNLKRSIQLAVDDAAEAEAIFIVADILHKRSKYTESQTFLNKYFQLSKNLDLPIESSIAVANYIQAYNYIKQKDYPSALNFYLKSISEIEVNEIKYAENKLITQTIYADAIARAGDCYFKQKNYEKASYLYDKLISENLSDFDYALYQKAIIQGLENKPYDKILSLESLINRAPKSQFADDALLELGNTYQTLGNNKDALDAFEKLVREFKNKSPLIAEAQLEIGLIIYNQGDINAALKAYKSVFDYNPSATQSNRALIAIEEIYIEDLQKPDEYFSFAEKVTGTKINDFAKDSINYQVAFSQFENGEYNKAVGQFGEYIEKYPRGNYILDAYYHRAESKVLLERYSDAVMDYDFVVDKGQSEYYLKAIRKAAIIYFNNEENFEKALEKYQLYASVSEDPEQQFEANLGAMRSAYKTKDETLAAKYAEFIINYSPVGKEDMSFAHFLIAKKAMGMEDYDKAINSFDLVSKTSSNSQAAESRYRIAQIYLFKEDYKKSESQAQDAISQSSNYPYWVAKSILLLSDIYVKNKDLFNARAAIEAVIENYKEDEGLLKEAQDKLAQVEAMEAKENRIKTDVPSDNLNMQIIDEKGSGNE